MLARPGGWSDGTSRSRKPGPNCATWIECPFKIRLILTSAEWPPWLPVSKPVIDIALKNSETYAARYDLRIVERLGFGIHGIVHVAEGKIKTENSAIKAHISAAPYLRECAVYGRLKKAAVSEILGFHVPQLIRVDNELRVIEMTIVTRPFVLDFAGAYLDAPPDFSEEIWAEWEAEKREQFGARWTTVQSLMGASEELDIHLVDVTPSNIGFLN